MGSSASGRFGRPARRTASALVALALAVVVAPKITFAATAASGRIVVLEATQDSNCGSGVVLRTINADGSDPRTLAAAAGVGVEWSPDGTTIAYSYGSEIRTIGADGSNEKFFADGTYPTWSPDGTQLAYGGVVDGRHVILRKAITGGPAVQVEHYDPATPYDSGTRSDGSTYDAYARADQTPAWSPDGNRIVFERTASVSYHAPNGTGLGSDDKFDLYTARVDGSGLKQLTGDNAVRDDMTQDSETNQLPTWSPDGSTVAFLFTRPNAAPNFYGNEIATVPADGGTTTVGPVVFYPRNDRPVYPEYAPSGALAYAANEAYTGPQGPAYGIYLGDRMIYEAPHGLCGFSWAGAVMTAPTAAFTAKLTGDAAHEWAFDGSASRAAAGTIASYRWSYGDGSDETTSTPTTTHTYADGTPHTATLTVLDANGNVSPAVSHVLTEPKLTVNSNGDDPAVKPKAGCDTGATAGPDDAPECTLRAAIQAVDAGAGSTITFALPTGSGTITPGKALPKITAAGATIDGSSQPSGSPTISSAGLVINGASGVSVKGLSVVAAPDIGIDFVNSPHGSVRGCSVGVRADGAADPGRAGVYVSDSPDTTIGGTDASAGNVIGGTAVALLVTNSAAVTVTGNSIGVTANGTTIADGDTGVLVLTRSGSIPGLNIEDNTIAGQTHNLALIGAGIAAPTITGNRVGVDARAKRRIGSPVDNIRLDGVADATVESNTVAGATDDILVAGSVQTTITADGDEFRLDYHRPDDPLAAQPLTGSGDTITGNTVGLVAGSASGPQEGIRVWEAADNTTVERNTVAGHASDEIQLSSSGATDLVTNTRITDNVVGLGSSGAPAQAGIVLTGTSAAHVESNTVGSVQTGIRVATSTGAVLATNTVGLGQDGASAAAVTTGVSIREDSPDATVGPDNVLGHAETALVLNGAHPRVFGNRIGVARFGASAAPNRTGVVVRADASLHDNTVTNSALAGITVDGAHVVTLRRNAVYATTTLTGITGAPTAPTLAGAARVQHGASIRTWLVLDGLPSSAAGGTIEVFGNTTCADPEGRVPLFTTPTSGHSTRVLSVAGRGTLKGLTVTYTDAAGSTSGFSNCADAVAGPDGDGDGIPDLVEANAPRPTNADAQFASFVADNQQWVIIQTVPGTQLVGVAPLDDPHPAGHPGVSFPVGVLTFAVEGIERGATAVVRIVLAGGSPTTGWTKYGPASAATYHGFAFDDATMTGAKVSSQTLDAVGPSTVIDLSITDGGRGDDDGTADARIVDPGAPSVGSQSTGPGSGPTSSPPSGSPPSGTTPAGTAAAAPGGAGPAGPAGHDAEGAGFAPAQTGADLMGPLEVGAATLLLGVLLTALATRRRLRTH